MTTPSAEPQQFGDVVTRARSAVSRSDSTHDMSVRHGDGGTDLERHDRPATRDTDVGDPCERDACERDACDRTPPRATRDDQRVQNHQVLAAPDAEVPCSGDVRETLRTRRDLTSPVDGATR